MLSHMIRRLYPVLALFVIFTIAPALFAQHPGVAASVTSHGFGGHMGAPGVRASVTSHGSFAPNHPVFHPLRPVPCCGVGFHHNGPIIRTSRRRGFFPQTFVYGVPYYYPYSYDDADDYSDAQPDSADQYAQSADQAPNEDEYDEYNAESSVFDRRVREYDPAPNRPAANDQPAPVANAEPESDPIIPPTVLVFRDGHQLEIANYAIVGDTLYDLTPGHARRVPLSQLDMNATQKQNDDRGTDFRLPASPQGS